MHQTRGDMLFQLFGPYQTNFWTQPFGLWADFIFGFLVFLWFIEMLFHDGPEALFGVAMRVSMDSVQFRKLCSRQRGTRMCMYSTLITSDSGLIQGVVSISILKGVECCWVLFNSTYFVWDASSRPTNLCTLMCFIPNDNWVLLFWDIIHFRVQFVLPAPFKSRQLNILCLQFSYLRNFINGFIELNSSAN